MGSGRARGKEADKRLAKKPAKKAAKSDKKAARKEEKKGDRKAKKVKKRSTKVKKRSTKTKPEDENLVADRGWVGSGRRGRSKGRLLDFNHLRGRVKVDLGRKRIDWAKRRNCYKRCSTLTQDRKRRKCYKMC